MGHHMSLVDSRFSILCKIGEGSFSNVFICLDNESSDRLLAAKIYKNDDATQLQIESKLLKMAKSRGIPKLFGNGFTKKGDK